jgi:exonuclease SbcD
LKYSASECSGESSGGEKSANLVTLGAKGELRVERLPLQPLHDSVVLRGTLVEIASTENRAAHKNDYVYAVVTDEDEPHDAGAVLQSAYERFLTLQFDNSRTRAASDSLQPLEGLALQGREVNINDADELFKLFQEHYRQHYQGREMSDAEAAEAKRRLNAGAGGES